MPHQIQRTVRLSPSKAAKYHDCSRAYYLQYVMKITPTVKSINLAFGVAIHYALEQFFKGMSQGLEVDMYPHFINKWEEMKAEGIRDSASCPMDQATEIGKRLLEQFPDRFRELGLKIATDPAGNPLLEVKLEAVLSNTQDQRLIFVGIIDAIFTDKQGHYWLLDWKTPSTPMRSETRDDDEFADIFLANTEQLMDYEILLRANPNILNGKPIRRVGYFELIKKAIPKTKAAKGPRIAPVEVVSAHTDTELDERMNKLLWTQFDINKGRFFKNPRMAYNSPCKMCDFARFCGKGDRSDLIFPDQQQSSVKPLSV